MNKEYWQMVLLGKPKIVFYVTILLFITTSVLLCFDLKSGETCAYAALIFAGLGWVNSAMASIHGSEAAKIRKVWFGWMALLLFVTITPSCLRRHPDGSANSPLTHMWDIGKDMFTKEPPLVIRHERRSELLGLEKVEFLIITNKFGEGIVPTAGTLTDANHTVAISLPAVFKPYDTVEVRLQSEKGKLSIEAGDVLTIKCEGYSKPLSLRW